MMVFSLSVACPQSNSRTQYAFDLLHLDGENLKDEPLTRRQAILREAFASTTFFHIAPALSGSLKTIIGKIQEFGFEGIIAKDRHPTGFYIA